MQRVGFIVDSQLPRLSFSTFKIGSLSTVLRGWPSSTAAGFMRCGWIIEAVSNQFDDLIYEWYRPWRSYEVLVFAKSFSNDCIKLALKSKDKGVKIIFDVNVDYFTQPCGSFHYSGMEPSPSQIENARQMVQIANAVIAASEYIADICGSKHPVAWVPDNIPPNSLPPGNATTIAPRGKVRFLWSGMPQKLVDLLLIEDLLLENSSRFELVLVTRHLDHLERCFEPFKGRLKKLLAHLQPQIIVFESIRQLLQVYSQGGVFLSPRFLDNSYNLGHSEWKITLPMSVGVPVICSPVRSYITAAERAAGGVRICLDLDEWAACFELLFNGALFQQDEHKAAVRMVEQYYQTDVIAGQHYNFVKEFI